MLADDGKQVIASAAAGDTEGAWQHMALVPAAGRTAVGRRQH